MLTILSPINTKLQHKSISENNPRPFGVQLAYLLFYQFKWWLVFLIRSICLCYKTFQYIILLSISVSSVATGRLIWFGGISLVWYQQKRVSPPPTPLNTPKGLFKTLAPHPLLFLIHKHFHPRFGSVWKGWGGGWGDEETGWYALEVILSPKNTRWNGTTRASHSDVGPTLRIPELVAFVWRDEFVVLFVVLSVWWYFVTV